MFGENTYIVWNAGTKQAAVIDPGMHNAAEELIFDSFITENKMRVSQLINTHMHLDHMPRQEKPMPFSEKRHQHKRACSVCL